MTISKKKSSSKFNALFNSVRVGDTSALSNAGPDKSKKTKESLRDDSNKKTDHKQNTKNNKNKSTKPNVNKNNKPSTKKNGTQTEHVEAKGNKSGNIITEHKQGAVLNKKSKINKKNGETKTDNGTQKTPSTQSIQTNGDKQTEHKRNTKKSSNVNSLLNAAKNNNQAANDNGTQTEHEKFSEEAVDVPLTGKSKHPGQVIKKGYSSEINISNNIKIYDDVNSIDLLSKIQMSILFAMYESIKENQTIDLVTGKMTINDIANKSAVNIKSIKTSIARLKEKNYISIYSRKNGRGGWVLYRLQRSTFLEIELAQTAKNNEQKGTILPAQKNEIDSWISNIDLDGLQDFGFTKNHFKRLEDKLTFKEVQDSIYHFSWGLRHNPKTQKYKDSAIAVLIGCLIKGTLWIEVTYKSRDEVMMEQEISDAKDIAKRNDDFQKNKFNQSFERWRINLSEDDIKKYTSDSLPKDKSVIIKPMIIGALRDYYKKNLWEKLLTDESLA
ncbi:hypothetical protein A0O36_01964 [Piscirickettsiaceae bacterium NZ-RLO1]|nr:hypothetical protein A0O36_01964 [Piscirickettsiaceae bacterium NZ-RLO1]